MKAALAIVASALACSAVVSGCAAAPDAPAALANASADSPPKICKRLPVMGSNFPKTVCSTAEEWAEFDRQTHESVDAFDEDRRAGNTQGSFENQ